MVDPKPSAAIADGLELVILRSGASSVCRVMVPLLAVEVMVEGVDVPVIESILLNKFWTVAVAGSIWLAPVPNVIEVPFTVMVSPAVNPSDDRVFATFAVERLLTALPVAVPAEKKSLPAWVADDATSEVLARFQTAPASAVLRLLVVTAVDGATGGTAVGLPGSIR